MDERALSFLLSSLSLSLLLLLALSLSLALSLFSLSLSLSCYFSFLCMCMRMPQLGAWVAVVVWATILFILRKRAFYDIPA